MSSMQSVDPLVSATKFEREVDQFGALAAEYGRRGWFLAEADFPTALVLMSPPQLKPAPLLTGVLFDYSDYDLRPPSVKLVDPFTRNPWPADKLPIVLDRRTEVEGPLPPGMVLPPGLEPPKMFQVQSLVQSYPNEDPFLCIAGVREYHDHPAHSGDAWELHRPAGAGKMIRLLEIIDKYGLQPLNGYGFNLEIKLTGFQQGEPPL